MKQDAFLSVCKAACTAIFFPILLSGCGSGDNQSKTAAATAPPPPEVDVITVTQSSVVLTQDLPGRLQAFRTAQVRARVEGVVEKRKFIEGSNVKEGDPLYQIFSRNYQTTYDSSKTDVAVARQTLARYKYLLDVKAVSLQEYELAEAKLKQAEAAFSKAREDLDNTRVPAPISGRIGRSQITEGALVGRNEATLLATIEQVDPLYVNFTQSGADTLRLQQAIKAGKLTRTESAGVQLVLEDGSTYPQSGKFLFSDLAVDPSTNSVSLRAEFPNPKQELLPGMFVRIRFPEANIDNALKVPQRALLADAQGQFVMIVDPQSKVAVQRVKTGSMSSGNFIITEGLKGGEQVIVNGLQKVRPGSVAKPVPLNQAANVNSPVALAHTKK
ncbi:multidrug efflux pump membrane fusion lipoprotein AcrA [Candidatus Nitrotoga sp. HW29]|uniref:efflux RND transporter periplasmic adaptor subunit n=1 Tax=Candidatus Nitrotoga sp. HW29 TaxID=2886963 RepID=UPI001EF267C8|nr:efflux RND transporter periplasmic adaptor subunit [Candidatus Nitrotoga sp. HW29]CAH1904684.1 multidrug efflux pump membrane fusion lipoprotein AcrA [Candidatus Nitrotoga sp. HW29]